MSDNKILRWWPVATFSIPLLLGGVGGYFNLQNRVAFADALSKDLAKSTAELKLAQAEHEKRLLQNEVAQEYIKQSLQDQDKDITKLDLKIDKILEAVQKKR